MKTRLNRLFFGLALLSACCLLFSLVAQNWMDLKPCRLCLAQRYIFLVAVVLGASGLVFHCKVIFCRLLLIVFMTGACIAVYQSLAHLGLFEAKCEIVPEYWQESLSFKKVINQPGTCSEQVLKVLGIPASVLNSFIYVSCCIVILLGAKMVRSGESNKKRLAIRRKGIQSATKCG